LLSVGLRNTKAAYLYGLLFTARQHSVLLQSAVLAMTDSVRPTVRPSDTRWYHTKTTLANIMRASLEDSPMTLASSWLTSPRNSNGNMGSEGAK